MEQKDAIQLISGGIVNSGLQHWADLGCGAGTFTRALADLLPFESYIHAVDKEQQVLPARINETAIGFKQGDFIGDEFMLNGLDGILMANSLYVRDKAGTEFFKGVSDLIPSVAGYSGNP